MLFGGAVRSDYPRAIIKGIDISEALGVPGVVKIVTAADLPGDCLLYTSTGCMSFTEKL